jgi:small GTP-binding protein
MELLRTGIPKMDDLLGGGIKQGESILLTGPLGADLETFCQQISSSVARTDGGCLYFVSDKFPSMVREKMASMSISPPPEKFRFLDGYSASVGLKSEEALYVKIPGKLEEVESSIIAAIRQFKPSFLVIDSLSSLLFLAKDRLSQATKFKEELSYAGTACLFLFSRLGEDDDAMMPELTKLFDRTVYIDSVEENFIERSFYTVSSQPSVHVPFKVAESGVYMSVPKILVTGTFHAGKSTFIHKLSTRAVSVDRLGTTIALDHGYVEYKGLAVDLFGTPGQENFNFILPILARDTFGIILVIDSTDMSMIKRAIDMLAMVAGNRIPLVIAANKSDLPSALPSDKIRQALGLPESVPIVRTVSTTGEGLGELLEKLFELILFSRHGGAKAS